MWGGELFQGCTAGDHRQSQSPGGGGECQATICQTPGPRPLSPPGCFRPLPGCTPSHTALIWPKPCWLGCLSSHCHLESEHPSQSRSILRLSDKSKGLSALLSVDGYESKGSCNALRYGVWEQGISPLSDPDKNETRLMASSSGMLRPWGDMTIVGVLFQRGFWSWGEAFGPPLVTDGERRPNLCP